MVLSAGCVVIAGNCWTKSQSPPYSPIGGGGGGVWLQMTGACITVKVLRMIYSLHSAPFLNNMVLIYGQCHEKTCFMPWCKAAVLFQIYEMSKILSGKQDFCINRVI